MPASTSLYLAPADPLSAPHTEQVQEVLHGLGVLAGPLAPAVFRAGEGFARHVVYTGCSPYLVMEPPQDGSRAFCHVALHGPYPQPRLVTGPNTVKPRCPGCRARFDDWRERLAGWQFAGASALCPACGRRWAPYRLDWRSHAVAGRFLVELRNVFPGEASPSDRLIAALQEATGLAWHYAWAGELDD